MFIEDRLDLLWINFLTADIDNALSTAQEIVPIVPPLYSIAGIDETVRPRPLLIEIGRCGSL
jgi:hypothetical protein